MAEVLVIGKKISEMGLVNEITGEEKIPTGVVGDKAVTTGQLLTYLENNGKVQWGRIEGDITNQADLQNQFTQERDTLKSYTQVALQEHIDATNEVFKYARDNGSALPYKEGISYEEDAVVVKDGVLQQWKDGSWRSAVAEGLSDAIQTFNTTEAGVDPVSGVSNGAYYNVRSTEDDSYLVEYQNIGGVPTPTGKSYPSGEVVKELQDGAEVQKQINDNQKEISQFLFPFYSLKKFGATGDGVTDDRQAIQDAVNFMSSIGGGTLVAPNGEYLLDSKTTETNVNADCLIKWKPNVSLVGLGQATKFKVGKFANSKFYMFYNYTDDLGEVSFENFSIDANGQENPALASSGYDQWVISIATANQVRIHSVNFYNAGGRQMVGLGSNHLLPTLKEAFITNCRVHKVATDITENDLQGDHSSFYISASYAEIKGNILRNDAPNTIATAIESHSIKSVIDGNIIDNYNLGVITAATVRSIDDHVITNNIITANMCWQPWIFNNHDVKRALFANNTCLQTTGAAGRNILDITNRVKSACTGIFSILNNTIVGSNVVEAQTGQHAIGIGDVATYKISGNTFRNVTGRVLSLGTLYSSDVVDIDFTDNKVENCNLTTNASYKEVIGFNTLGSIKVLKVKGNTFRSDSSSFSNRVINGTCAVSIFEFEDNTETGAGFTSVANWGEGKLGYSKVRHATKISGKPVFPASANSTWVIVSPSDGAILREYKKLRSSTANAYWSAIHYVEGSKPDGFDSFHGDRAINMTPAIGSPTEWICTVAGTPGTWVPSGYIGTPTTTTAALQGIGIPINTVDKFNGKQVINTTDSKVYYATGAAAGAAWKSFDGATTITPA